MKPNILDRQWKYVNAASTNLAKTFARIRREQEAEAKRNAANDSEAARKVRKIAAS